MNIPGLVNPNASNPGLPNYFQMLAQEVEVTFRDDETGQIEHSVNLVSGIQAHDFTQRHPIHSSHIVLRIRMFAHLPHLGGGHHDFNLRLNSWNQLINLLNHTGWHA